MSEDLNRRVGEALDSTQIMALSTIGPDGPWTSPVQYHHNERLDLFFLSMPHTRHVRNILSDPRVSVAIYSHPGPPGGNLGLQIGGRAEHLNAESTNDGWQSFKITPEDVWCFDSRVYGRQPRRVDLTDLHLQRATNRITARPPHGEPEHERHP